MYLYHLHGFHAIDFKKHFIDLYQNVTEKLFVHVNIGVEVEIRNQTFRLNGLNGMVALNEIDFLIDGSPISVSLSLPRLGFLRIGGLRGVKLNPLLNSSIEMLRG